VAQRLVTAIAATGAPGAYLDLDAVGHHVVGPGDDAASRSARRRIVETFGPEVAAPAEKSGEVGAIDRRRLGAIVFADAAALARLNEIMREPMMAELYRRSRALGPGVVVIEGAILVEAGWSRLVNNNVVLVDAAEAVRVERVAARPGTTREQAQDRMRRQVSPPERRAILERRISSDAWGKIWDVRNDGGEPDLAALAADIVARYRERTVAPASS
jgi:dephospho-CoA kinase